MREKTMALLKLKHVMADTDRHGNVRHYFRKNGRKIRLHGAIGSQEFMAAYAAAEQGSRIPQLRTTACSPDSFKALCEAFFRAATFKQLTPRSQRYRRLLLDGFCREHGDKPYRLMERHHVLAFRDEIAHKPGAATNLVKALRHVFSFAVSYNLAKANPAQSVAYLRKKNGGFHSWSIDEVRQFEAAHGVGSKARLAMALLFYTGQRRSDVVAFGRQMLRGGKIHYTQQKTGRRMATRIIRPLADIIAATPSGGLAFLETSHGQPYTSNGFGNAFRAWCNEAGLPHCSAHGLRKALGARLAEIGATTSEIQAALGHETLSEADRYTRAANRDTNTDAAMELFENNIAPLSSALEKSGAKKGKNRV
jgi:integrase